MDHPRSSGILLHITSLPGPFEIGDMGPAAYDFADWLEEAGQRIWQVLPLVPTGLGNSPYSSPSTFAGNPLLISPELLAEDDLLELETLPPPSTSSQVDWGAARRNKKQVLGEAFEAFEEGASSLHDAFVDFCEAEAEWLDSYALFMALRERFDGKPWHEWPADYRDRDPGALAEAAERAERCIRKHKFWQFLFDRQWAALRAYCHDRDIRIFGDLPIYVAQDSADVWANRELFKLDAKGRPTVVAGVPPDYFSETGQRWGNPIYRWDEMADNDYAWWQARLGRALTWFDLIRLDHFRGFEAYWAIPAEEETAINGEWQPGPGADFFEALARTLGPLPLVAEDLGTITPSVRRLMQRFDLPGMRVLQFGMHGDPDSGYLPHNYAARTVAYTGTHDNDTLAGWWNECEEETREFTSAYFNFDADEPSAPTWEMLRGLFGSVAQMVVVPLQDVLGLGNEARMNVPGQADGNWGWRVPSGSLDTELGERLARLALLYGRTPTRRADEVAVSPPVELDTIS